MKTYLFPEVAGHGETTEWVPADVARELLEASQKVLAGLDRRIRYAKDETPVFDGIADLYEAIEKMRGES